MKQYAILKQFTRFAAFTVFLFASFNTAFASATPTLTLSSTGTSDNVQLNVTGDPNSSVILFYTPTNLTLQIKAIGTTNASGNFSTTISSGTYGLKTNNPVYVSIGGVSGPISSTALWPTVTTTTSNLLTMSQAGLVLSVGQTSTLTATNNTSGSLYVSNNSNPSVASAAVNGNQVTFLALGYGSTAITICAQGYTANCPVVYLTVQNSAGSSLTLSQSSASLAYGQSTAVTISGGTGSYFVSNNSSTGNVTASINGNILTLGGNSTTSGTYSVTVCSTDMSSCGVVNVTLGSTSSANVQFSQSAVTLAQGQSTTVTVYGNTSATYYISSNSNASVTQTSISGNIISLYGVSGGTSIVSVCATVGGCSNITVTVNASSTVSAVALSQSSLSLAIGQTASVNISGGTAPYVLLTTSNSIFQAGISGSSLFITGAGAGSAQITVCSSGSIGCSSLSLQVGGTTTTTTTTTSSSVGTSFLNFSSPNPSLTIGQTTNITVSNGSTNSYTIGYNSNSGTVQATMSGNVLSLYGLRNGYVVIVVCDTTNDCGALPVTVGVSNPGTTATTSTVDIGCMSGSVFSTTTGQRCPVQTQTSTTPATAVKYQFTIFLQEGASGNEVLELQKRLQSLGYFNGPLNGNFGPMTKAAVAAFQRAHGISAPGYVGPSTRAILNQN